MEEFVILVTNVEVRKAFDVVNAVRHHFGEDSCLLSANRRPSWLLRWSYNSRVYVLRDDSYNHFEQDLDKLLDLPALIDKTIVYLPVEEQATLFFYRFLSGHPGLRRLKYLLPPEASFALARNKLHLAQYCLANGFKVPRLIERAEWKALQENFIRVIIKPAVGSGGRGIRRVDSPAQLTAVVVGDGEFAQELIGTGRAIEGAFFLFHEGVLVNAFTHCRIRTAPRRGGVSVLSKTTNNRRLIKIGASILSKLKWDGLAMLEFVHDPRQGDYLLLEINPRLWGSALLSEFCGANLIKQYVSLALGHKLERTEPQLGTYIRWLFPYDVLDLLKGELTPSEFWFRPAEPVCYIGFTFSSWPRSLCFILASIFNPQNFRKFASKTANRCF